MVPVFCSTPLPSTTRAWVIWPSFLISNVYVPAFGTLIVFGVIENSFSEREMVCSGGPELVDDADGLFELPPQAERSRTAGARIQTRRIVTSYGRVSRSDSAIP